MRGRGVHRQLAGAIALAALAGCSGHSSRLPEQSAAVIAAVAVPAAAPAIVEEAAAPRAAEPFSDRGLSDAIRMAISRHPDVARAKALITKAQAGIGAVKAQWYPELTYSVSPGYRPDNFGTASAGASQLIFDFGKSRAELNAAAADEEKSRHQLLLALETVSGQVAQHYASLSAAAALRAEADRYVAALKMLQSRVASRVDAGASDVSDLVTADVAVGRAEGERAKAEAQVLLARSNLAQLTGSAAHRASSLPALLRLVRILAAAEDQSRSPAVRAAQSALDSAGYNVEKARAERLPPLRAAGQYAATLGDDGFDGDAWIGLKAESAISTGGLASRKIEAAEAERDAAAQFLAGETLRATTVFKQSVLEAREAQSRSERFLGIHRLAQRSSELAWEHYQLDKQPLSETINSEREKFNAMADVVQARGDAVKAAFRGLAAMGALTHQLMEDGG